MQAQQLTGQNEKGNRAEGTIAALVEEREQLSGQAGGEEGLLRSDRPFYPAFPLLPTALKVANKRIPGHKRSATYTTKPEAAGLKAFGSPRDSFSNTSGEVFSPKTNLTFFFRQKLEYFANYGTKVVKIQFRGRAGREMGAWIAQLHNSAASSLGNPKPHEQQQFEPVSHCSSEQCLSEC